MNTIGVIIMLFMLIVITLSIFYLSKETIRIANNRTYIEDKSQRKVFVEKIVQGIGRPGLESSHRLVVIREIDTQTLYAIHEEFFNIWFTPIKEWEERNERDKKY